MSGRLLSFSQYLGGADNVKVIEMFPTTSKTFKYTFGTDINQWIFDSTYQSLLLDKVTYDRNTGEPNFTDTNILGYWPEVSPGNNATITRPQGSNPNGEIYFKIPAQRYTGQLFPNARENVVMTVVGFTWNMDNIELEVAGTTESHRWGIIERYIPGPTNAVGDPALDAGFIPYGVGAVTQANITYTADGAQPDDFVYDTPFRYTDSDQNSPTSNGTGLSVTLTWTQGISTPRFGINSAGRGYRTGDEILIYDEQLGNGGSGVTTLSINSVS